MLTQTRLRTALALTAAAVLAAGLCAPTALAQEPAISPPSTGAGEPADPATDPAEPGTGDGPGAAAVPPAPGDPPDAPAVEDPPGEPDPTTPAPGDTPPAAQEDEGDTALPESRPGDDGYAEIERLAQAIEIIRQTYVDEDKVTYERLVNSALQGMLGDLDPHCQYIHPQVFEQFKREQTNTYDGVGISIAFDGGDLSIVSVREDGPAAAAGVLPGDIVLKIGEDLTEDLGLTEAVMRLDGEPGEPLTLTLRRPATKEVLEVEMVRQVIQMETVKDAMLLPPAIAGDDLKVGYVRLLQFNEPSAQELEAALDSLEAQGMDALVLDLRNNPGGLLSTAIEVLGLFLPPDTLVLTTEGRIDAHDRTSYRTPERQRRPRGYPVSVLVNHGSASASEVVSGALQDLKRAVIVGETTFGKGSVQSIIPAGGDDGAALRLTTAKYYTPSHRTIHEYGVTPNIVATLTPSEEKALFQWWRDHALNNARPKELVKVGDRQLQRATDVLKGLAAYRGARD